MSYVCAINKPSALNLLDDALLGLTAAERSTDITAGLTSIAGVSAKTVGDHTAYDHGTVATKDVLSTPTEITVHGASSSMKLTIAVEGSLTEALAQAVKPQGLQFTGFKPAQSLKH